MKTTIEVSPLLVRIPTNLKEWLKNAAKAERRTMTAQLLHILEQAKDEMPAANAKEAA